MTVLLFITAFYQNTAVKPLALAMERVNILLTQDTPISNAENVKRWVIDTVSAVCKI